MPEPVQFLDLKTKEIFTSRDYTSDINVKGMRILRTVSPSGWPTVKILGRA